MAKKLLERVREEIRLRHLSPRTAKSYVAWVRCFVRHCQLRHPLQCGEPEVRAFLTVLADRGLSAASQNQAYAAVAFLYRDVLRVEAPLPGASVRAKRAHRLPNILPASDVRRVLAELSGDVRLVCDLLYGSGLRLMECLQLRIKDLDLERQQIHVRAGKGDKDRRTVVPATLIPVLRERVFDLRRRHMQDIARGGGYVRLPNALERKMPMAARDWRWSWLFPSSREYIDRESRKRHRHHLYATTVQRAIAAAGRRSGIARRVTAHTFRHCSATHLLRAGYDTRTVQELLGQRDVSTTMVYLHVLDRGVGVRSPLDTVEGG